jgi:hypothetical protein
VLLAGRAECTGHVTLDGSKQKHRDVRVKMIAMDRLGGNADPLAQAGG